VDELFKAVAAVARMVSPEKIQSVATRIRKADRKNAATILPSVVGTPLAADLLTQLVDVWQSTSVSAEQLALMLLAASHCVNKVPNEQTTELVWTGPTTPFVSARRTEQALLQVINASQSELYVTSFVAHDVSGIVSALDMANSRGVAIHLLLESSQDQGGKISFDIVSNMKKKIPTAHYYRWGDRSEEFISGSLHAKVAVADGEICFITSANLTGYAMEKNMEAGVLIKGGIIPEQLRQHLRALIDMRVVQSA
jgi:phosphatidylserine/phosphatidylglycerophosphate/cardiolipin synthase-like enzyme